MYKFLIYQNKMTNKKPIPVVIDNDCGCDDFFALIWSMIMHKKWHIDIKALTTTGGNVNAKATFTNNIRACEMMWLELPIGKAENKSDAEDASHIHGNDGIGGLSKYLPEPKQVTAHDSEELLIENLNKHEDELILLVTGPATNLASIETKNPGILKKAKQIIIMGGAVLVPGNVTPKAEFNVFFDPESSKVVYESGANIVLAPLDITTQTIFGLQDLDPVLSHINHEEHRKFLTELTKFTIGTNMMYRETHYKKGFFVHDANTIGFLMYPHLYKGTFYDVKVETKGEFTRGETVIDIRNHPKDTTNMYVITEVDKIGFLEAMTEDFKDFDFSKKKNLIT